jgi:hypothetical protein
MTRPGGARAPLFATRWVRAFEDDDPRGAVYRPDRADLPLSRRPRDRFELSEDGSARLYAPGPDDRLIARDATWSREDEDIVVRLRGSEAVEMRIVEQSPQRLVVRR